MTRPIRVAHVVASAGATGVESHLIALLAAFDRSEVEPVLFAPGPGPLVDQLRARGVPVEFGAPLRKLAFTESRRLARRWRGAFDVVHAHGPRATFWAVRAARQARIPAFVATIHELRWRSLPSGPKRSLWIALEDHALARAHRLIAVSEAVRGEVTARRPEWSSRVSVVTGSAPLLFDAARLPRAHPERREAGRLRLVSIGRLEWVKGYDVLFDALARLSARGVDFTLDLVGEGVLGAELRGLATRLGIGARIRWEPRPTDLPGLLAGSHAYVSATRAETFGIAVLEAMAVGLPAVAPAVGGLTELVAHGESGLLVEPEPRGSLSERLADAIATLAAEPARAARMGEAGARRAAERFSPVALARGVTSVYREILAARAV